MKEKVHVVLAEPAAGAVFKSDETTGKKRGKLTEKRGGG